MPPRSTPWPTTFDHLSIHAHQPALPYLLTATKKEGLGLINASYETCEASQAHHFFFFKLLLMLHHRAVLSTLTVKHYLPFSRKANLALLVSRNERLGAHQD